MTPVQQYLNSRKEQLFTEEMTMGNICSFLDLATWWVGRDTGSGQALHFKAGKRQFIGGEQYK